MRSRSHDDAMSELYRSDPALALDVINGILEEGDQAELLVMLRQLAQASAACRRWPSRRI